MRDRLIEHCKKVYVWDLLKRFKPKGESIDFAMANGEIVYYVIDLTTSRTNFNGTRRWFKCPSCGLRVGCLYADKGVLRCRSCQGMYYSCQKYHRHMFYEIAGKYLLRALKLEKEINRKWQRRWRIPILLDLYNHINNCYENGLRRLTDEVVYSNT